jgi:hypothetical protein
LKNRIFFLSLLFILNALFLFPQETENENRTEPETPTELENPASAALPESEMLYVISGFEFDIKGRTRPFAILYNAELEVGEKIQGRAALDAFIADKTQMLINQRVLKDNVLITYTVGERAQDGSYPVILSIKVEDTWNIIAIPRPTYSSNSGFDITIKARDYNFLGTMNPLRLDLGYSYDEEQNHSFNLMLDTDTPFKLFDLYWNIDFDHDFSYRPNMDEPYYYKNTTGLSVEVPFKRTTFTFGFDESFILNQENARRYREQYGRFQEGLYMSSKPYVAWKIPTGFHYYHLGEVTYTPQISATFNHEFTAWPLADFRKGPFLNFSHNLSFGRVDWVDNFLKGVSASISNSFSYDFYKSRNDIEPWGASLNIKGAGHKIVGERFNFSTRLMYRHWFYDDYTDSGGDAIRGIKDNDIVADYMFSVNLDFTFKLLRFLPSVWFKNNKWRVINFDLHVTPFVDLGLFNNPITQEPFGFDNLLVGGGLEVIVYPLSWRSLFLRASAGLGIKTANLRAGFSRELYIGTELHY